MPDFSRYNEKAIIINIAAGDERAFRAFFDLYKERFYAVALKMTRSDEVAEDIVQDVFINISIKRKSIMEVENLSSYFFTCVYRTVYQHYRKLALEKKLLHGVLVSKESVNTTEEMILAHESEKLVFQAVAKLPPSNKLSSNLANRKGSAGKISRVN